jgi:hypothetical protein
MFGKITYFVGGMPAAVGILIVASAVGIYSTTLGFNGMLLEWGNDHLPLDHWWGFVWCHIDAFGVNAMPTAIFLTLILAMLNFDITDD